MDEPTQAPIPDKPAIPDDIPLGIKIANKRIVNALEQIEKIIQSDTNAELKAEALLFHLVCLGEACAYQTDTKYFKGNSESYKLFMKEAVQLRDGLLHRCNPNYSPQLVIAICSHLLILLQGKLKSDIFVHSTNFDFNGLINDCFKPMQVMFPSRKVDKYDADAQRKMYYPTLYALIDKLEEFIRMGGKSLNDSDHLKDITTDMQSVLATALQGCVFTILTLANSERHPLVIPADLQLDDIIALSNERNKAIHLNTDYTQESLKSAINHICNYEPSLKKAAVGTSKRILNFQEVMHTSQQEGFILNEKASGSVLLVLNNMTHKLQQENQKFSAESAKFSAESASKSKELEENREKQKELSRLNREKDAKIKERDDSMTVLDSQVQKLKAELSSVSNKKDNEHAAVTNELKSQINDLETKNRSLAADLSLKSAKLKETEAQLKTSAAKLKTSESNNAELKNEFSKAQENAKDELSKAKKQAERQQKFISTTLAKKEELEKKQQLYENQCAEKDSEIQKYKSNLATKDTEIEILKQQIEQLQQELSQKSSPPLAEQPAVETMTEPHTTDTTQSEHSSESNFANFPGSDGRRIALSANGKGADSNVSAEGPTSAAKENDSKTLKGSS